MLMLLAGCLFLLFFASSSLLLSSTLPRSRSRSHLVPIAQTGVHTRRTTLNRQQPAKVISRRRKRKTKRKATKKGGAHFLT
ncbi:MAG: hypothetical protein JOS17DRAFT_729750 [Linnemannia elongata]|nr:MAG: hypothetical protein JOS17DRAFT_729750 [Linnemannia elongata]